MKVETKETRQVAVQFGGLRVAVTIEGEKYRTDQRLAGDVDITTVDACGNVTRIMKLPADVVAALSPLLHAALCSSTVRETSFCTDDPEHGFYACESVFSYECPKCYAAKKARAEREDVQQEAQPEVISF